MTVITAPLTSLSAPLANAFTIHVSVMDTMTVLAFTVMKTTVGRAIQVSTGVLMATVFYTLKDVMDTMTVGITQMNTVVVL
jgi:hypothetical protein